MLSLRRDDVTTTRTVVRITNFNPRLREGGDDIYHAPSCCKKISIHASAKEATLLRRMRERDSTISIHASAKEATVGDARCSILRCNFNPRLREGGDHLIQRFSHHYHYFNPRLREGGDEIRFRSDQNHTISIHASAKEATLFHR